MLKAIEQARKQHIKAIESMLYEDCCNIIEYQSVKDPLTKVTGKKEVLIYENQPCDLTYSTPKNANNTESATVINQTPLIILSKDIIVKPGSKIVVTKESDKVEVTSPKTTTFKNSGASAIFKTHQEISLELFKGWA